MAGEKILIVDDDMNMLEVLNLRLQAEGYEVSTTSNTADALSQSRDTLFDLALLDLKLGGQSGIQLMKDIHQTSMDMPIIILTAFGTIETAVEAMKEGAYSYLTKPFDRRELLLQIKNGLEKYKLSREVRRLKDLVGEKYGLKNIIGKSKKMQDVLEQVLRAAEVDSNVCIIGESGTGKELIAKSLHILSHREEKPFVAINSAAIPEGLFEAELFGYQKGAFTGAISSKRGYFAKADGGTLFLDEIAEMPESMQAKLLRVLQDKTFYPLGGEKPVEVDIRIIVATNKNLEEEVKTGNFREDLFYRIHVIPIHLPLLKDRKEDILLLTDHFIKKFNNEMNKDIKGLSASAFQYLLSHLWPGNVRELENTIEYAMAMASSSIIDADLIFPRKPKDKGSLKPLKKAKDEFEKDYILNLLTSTKGNVSKAARMAAKHRSDFYNLLKKHDLKAIDFKG